MESHPAFSGASTLPYFYKRLGNNLSSSVGLFAYDAVIYRLVKSRERRRQLQSYLEKISAWHEK